MKTIITYVFYLHFIVNNFYIYRPGHYCEKGTLDKESCPPGTFSPSYENKKIEDCEQCTSGSFICTC